MRSRLHRGDNMELLRELDDASIDVAYLDPPFSSGEDRNALLREAADDDADEITAFADSWSWSETSESALLSIGDTEPSLVAYFDAMEKVLGRGARLAYLLMLGPRVAHVRRVLASSGVIYVHCDTRMSHHVRLLLDSVFGADRFRNEIVWKRSSGHNNCRTKYGAAHDTLLVYARSSRTRWNEQFRPHDPRYVASFFRHVDPETGRRYRLQNTVNPNRNRPNLTYEWNGHLRTWKWSRERMEQLESQGRILYSRTGYPQLKQYLDENPGRRLQDVWDDVESLQSRRGERLGYPTQKPLGLMKRILAPHVGPESVVLDPFVGSGGTLVAAEDMGLRWVGADASHLAISLARYRLADSDYEVTGLPESSEEALRLRATSPQSFAWWALSLVGARPTVKEAREGGSRLVDGVVEDEGGSRMLVHVAGSRVSKAVLLELVAECQRTAAHRVMVLALETRFAAGAKALLARSEVELLDVEALIGGGAPAASLEAA